MAGQRLNAQEYTDGDTTNFDTTIEIKNQQFETGDNNQNEPDTAFLAPFYREISPDSLLTLKQDKAFAYMKYIDSFFRHQQSLSKAVTGSETIVKPGFFDNIGLRGLYALVAIACLLWIAWKLIFSNASIFARNKKQAVEYVEMQTKEMPDAEEMLRIEKAINAGQFRVATRFMFLFTLKKMAEKQVILPAVQKTNYQYLNEIKNEHLKNEFSPLVLDYEFIWFGEFMPSTQQFEEIQNRYKMFWKNWV